MAWQQDLMQTSNSLQQIGAQFELLQSAFASLQSQHDAATAQAIQWGKAQGVALNADGVAASVETPYVLIRVDEKTYKMVMWRGRADVPIIGEFDFQTDGFTVSTVTPSSRLFSNVPPWVDKVTGWHAAPFGVSVDLRKGALRVTEGDPRAFREMFRAHLGNAIDDHSFKVQTGAAWLRFLKGLLDRGIAPINRLPVAPEHWDANAPCKIELRPYQQEFISLFLKNGSQTIVLTSGGGKTFVALYLIAHLIGRKYIFCDSDFLVGQWRARLKEYVPNADVVVMTYQAASRAPQSLKGVLAISDEGHRLPAPTWSKLAFADVDYQVSMTATPGDADRRTMLFALGGPVHRTPPEVLIKEGVLNRPKVQVLQVPDLAFKIQWLKDALAKHHAQRVLVYCDSLKLGKDLERILGIPFVYGETKNKFEAVTNAPHCILSKAVETALDLTDLALIIEVDVSRTGKSMISGGQRGGRAGHSRIQCEFVELMTPDELRRFGNRLVGIEMMYGDVITYKDLTGQGTTIASRQTKTRSAATAPVLDKASNAVKKALTVPGVRRGIIDAEAKLGASRQGYAAKAFAILVDLGSGTSEELRRKADKPMKTWEPYQAGLNALVSVGLVRLESKTYTRAR
jgi:hypothetical protein